LRNYKGYCIDACFYRPDESILTEDEVQGRYTLNWLLKTCIDLYENSTLDRLN